MYYNKNILFGPNLSTLIKISKVEELKEYIQFKINFSLLIFGYLGLK